MNFVLIDIIFIVFLLIMLIIGYKKGFVLRLYDLLMSVLVFGLSLFLTKPLSSFIQIYHYSTVDQISMMVAKAMNHFCVFILLFILLSVVRLFLGLLLKPLIQKITHYLTITSFIDHFLGCLLSGIEALFLSYIVIVFLFVPFYDEANQMIDDSMIVKEIVNIVPDVSSQIIDNVSQMKDLDIQTVSNESLLNLTLTAYHYEIIDSSQALQILENHIFPHFDNESLSIDLRQKEYLQDILLDNGYNNDEIQSILINIRESDK